MASGGTDATGSRLPRAKRRPNMGVVDYTLAKRAIIREVRRGVRPLLEVCDAHPELLRAAKHIGERTSRACPVCSQDELRLLAYVYADELKRDNGRVYTLDKAMSVAARFRGGAVYVVEVCTGCSWNHLSEAFRGRSAG